MANVNPTRLALNRQYPHEYNVWKSMRSRCANPKNSSWRYYGEKGISVCERWAVFAVFLDDMGTAPSSEHQIERDRSDGNYEPGNCSWATPAEQQMNTSKVRFLTCRGVTLALQDWAELFGLNPNTLRARVDELGWTVEDALFAGTMRQFRQRKPRTDVQPRDPETQQWTRAESA